MELEIKVMWCKGLTTFNFFQKLTVYTTVSITSSNERIKLTQDQKQEQKTPIDENGEGNPEWNYTMKFDLRPLYTINPNLNDFSLLFQFRCPGQLFGDKAIGEVRVPLRELIQSVSCEVFRFVKYEVRNPEGKHNGILDFCYKLIGNDVGMINPHHDVQITGYNHHHHHHHHHHDHHHDNHDHHHDYHDHDHHHHQSQEQHHTNSDAHTQNMIEHNHNHNHNHDHLNEPFSISNSDVIQYPKIDFDEPSVPPLVYPPSASFTSSSSSNGAHYNPSTPPLVYPPPSSSYYTSSSSFTSTNDTHYNPSAPPLVFPPPSSQMWDPATLPPPCHYPPPPLQQPHVYPPPPLHQQQQPYGDPHWGYQRAHSYH